MFAAQLDANRGDGVRLAARLPSIRSSRYSTGSWHNHHTHFAVTALYARSTAATSAGATQPSLRECVRLAIRRYLADLDGHPPEALYTMVLHEIEAPLLIEVLHYCHGNQSRAAEALGINRATLRKKLQEHDLG